MKVYVVFSELEWTESYDVVSMDCIDCRENVIGICSTEEKAKDFIRTYVLQEEEIVTKDYYDKSERRVIECKDNGWITDKSYTIYWKMFEVDKGLV